MDDSEKDSVNIAAMNSSIPPSIPFWICSTDTVGNILESHGVPASFQDTWHGISNIESLGPHFKTALLSKIYPYEWTELHIGSFDVPFRIKVVQSKDVLWWSLMPEEKSDLLALKYAALFHSAFQFTGLLDPEGRILELNNTAATFGGFPQEEVIGKFIWETPFWLHSADRIQVRMAVEKATRGTVVSFQTQIQNHGHDIAHIDFAIKPIFNHRNELIYLLPQGREVTQFVNKNRILTRLTDLFNEAQAISQLGGWEFFPDSGLFDWTDEVYRIWAWPKKKPLGLSDLESLIHPQDRDFFSASMKQALHMGPDCDLELRIQLLEHPVKWVRILTKSIFDQDGRLSLVRGIFQDVTEKKNGEFRRERTRQMIQHIGDAVVEMNGLGHFTFVSPGAERIFGQPEASFIEQSIYTWIHTEHKDIVRKVFQEVLGQQTSQFLTFKFLHPDKGYIWLEATVVGYQRPDGELVLLLTARDVTHQLALQQKLTQHERLLESVAKATGLLLRVPNLQEALFEGLALLGQATEVDRVYVFRNGLANDPKALFTSQWMEWNSGSALPQIDNPDLQDIPFEVVSAFVDPLLEGHSFSVRVKDLEPGQLKDLLEAQEILTLLVLPVYLKDHFWGFIGFDDCTHMRVWTETETHVLLSFTESLAAAITRNALEKDLLETSRMAQEASRLKGDFLTNMSHEIRTPLNGIVGFTELLLTTDTTDRQKQYLNSVHTAANTLLHLINDILDFSKIEAGKLELVPEETDLIKLVEKAIEVVRYAAHQNQITLVLDVAPDLPASAFCDGGRILQILVNLLGNAVKFTEKGEVVLKVYATPISENGEADIHVSVSDTGIGIPFDKQSQIFELFSQADSSITRKYGGTGLGLNITTNLLHRMGSKLSFESEPGKGSHFSFTLRLSCSPPEPPPQVSIRKAWLLEPHASAAHALEKWLRFMGIEVFRFNTFEELPIYSDQMVLPDLILLSESALPAEDTWLTLLHNQYKGVPSPTIIIMGQSPWKISLSAVPVPMFIQLPVKRTDLLYMLMEKSVKSMVEDPAVKPEPSPSLAFEILVAEDNELNMLLVKNMLLRHFPLARIHMASSGLEAVAVFARTHPHFILMDIQMPELDGLEATKQIRMVESEAGLTPVPIIALTAGVLLGEKERALECGMQGFISKPFVEKELIQAIQHFLPQGTLDVSQAEPVDIFGQFSEAFDQNRLKAQFGTDIQYMAMIFSHFVPLIGPDVQAIQEAAKHQDISQLMRIIHKIKSNFSMVGLLEVERACMVAEQKLMELTVFPEQDIAHLMHLLHQALGFITQENQRLKSYLDHD